MGLPGERGKKLRIYPTNLTTRRQSMPCKALRLMTWRRVVESDGLFSFTPVTAKEMPRNTVVDINNYPWKKHCRGLIQLPVAA